MALERAELEKDATMTPRFFLFDYLYLKTCRIRDLDYLGMWFGLEFGREIWTVVDLVVWIYVTLLFSEWTTLSLHSFKHRLHASEQETDKAKHPISIATQFSSWKLITL